MRVLVVILSLLFFVAVPLYSQPDSLELDDSGGINFFIELSTSGQNLNSLNNELRNAGFPEFENQGFYMTSIGYDLYLSNFILGVEIGANLFKNDKLIDVKRSNLKTTLLSLNLSYKFQPFSFLRIYPLAGLDADRSELTLTYDISQGENITNSVGKITSFDKEGLLFNLGLGADFLIDIGTKEVHYEYYKMTDITKGKTKEYSETYSITHSRLTISFEAKYIIGLKDEWEFEGNKFDIPGLYPGRFVVGLKLGHEMLMEIFRMPEEEE